MPFCWFYLYHLRLRKGEREARKRWWVRLAGMWKKDNGVAYEDQPSEQPRCLWVCFLSGRHVHLAWTLTFDPLKTQKASVDIFSVHFVKCILVYTMAVFCFRAHSPSTLPAWYNINICCFFSQYEYNNTIAEYTFYLQKKIHLKTISSQHLTD